MREQDHKIHTVELIMSSVFKPVKGKTKDVLYINVRVTTWIRKATNWTTA